MSQLVAYKSVLHQMTETTPTCLWNDSAAISELTPSIEQSGTVGATCNPVIVLEVLKKEMHLWKDRISRPDRRDAHGDGRPDRLEDRGGDIGQGRRSCWSRSSNATRGRNGRLSIQTDPRYYRELARPSWSRPCISAGWRPT